MNSRDPLCADRPQVRHQLVVGHPHAVVAEDQPALVRLALDGDLQRPGVAVGFVGQGTYRILSRASEAFEISSRRAISRLW